LEKEEAFNQPEEGGATKQSATCSKQIYISWSMTVGRYSLHPSIQRHIFYTI
jgi:hypothetical protein